MAVYLIGGELQSWDLQKGLALTLLVLLPAMAFACAWRAPGRGALSTELGLRAAPPLSLLGALLCIPALVVGISKLGELQQQLLPIPRAMANTSALESLFGVLSPWMLVLLFAAAPAIGEELLYRGALTSALRRNLSPLRTILIQAAFFAAAHASIYRLIPTFLMGLVLGYLRLSTKSLMACVVVHCGYNAALTLEAAEHLTWLDRAWGPHLAWTALPGIALLRLGSRRI